MIRYPREILAVTFTNKAAREMKERVEQQLGAPAEGLWLGTFHALASKILRRHAEEVGLDSNFTIIDTDDQVRLVKQLLQAEGIDEKRWPARSVLHAIQRWKDRGLTPEKVTAADAGDFCGGRATELYDAYQKRLRTLNACDFGDLLLHNLTLFQNEEILGKYQQQFRYILVDEYQDTNVAQYLWLRLLAQGHRNICCVGDDDQSIYGWRGAEVGNILKFEQDFPGARIIRLEKNYRSTAPILAAAGHLIAHNEGRMGKTLWTEADGGETIRVRGLWDGDAEARFIGEEIEDLQRQGHSLGEIAILVRTGAQTRAFEERFLTLGLPYRVIGGPRFYERLEIRDALAYLRLIQSIDDDLAFERIVNTPKRGLGNKAVQTLHVTARAAGTSLMRAAMRLIETEELRPQARKALRGLMESFARWRQLAQEVDHCELARTVLEESGYTDMWQQDKSAEAPGRLDNLKELIQAMGEFDSLGGFLEHVSLVMETAEATNAEMVTVMTLHGAKGLEFDTVFLAGWEEGLFPNQRAMDEHGLKGLEEERRLAYVGLTRARRRAVVTFAANRRMYGSFNAAVPSRFVDELPKEHTTVESDPGLYGSGPGSARGGFGDGFGGAFGGNLAESGSRWSPGMARARARQGEGSRFIEGTAEVIDSHPGSFGRGDRVFHRKFGYGTVQAAEGERLTIAFDKAGAKKVIASFVVAADRAD
jgi:DNA helicase-2/ATP-dependent DNA helicase PcrA